MSRLGRDERWEKEADRMCGKMDDEPDTDGSKGDKREDGCREKRWMKEIMDERESEEWKER